MRKNIPILLCMLGLASISFAQTITGYVRSSQGPLAGVSVVEKGTSNGTSTDSSGYYKIDVRSGSVLIFSYVNMKTQEVAVNKRHNLDIVMESVTGDLSEVFVVAYGSAKKESFTGAVSVANQNDISKVVTTTITGALQGTVSGVQVINTNAQPGAAPQLRVRGISSLTGSSDPLIVVNGAPFGGSLNSIDPNDVESITVLKDASATSIYGSRAAAGLVVITTKKGRGGKPVVQFNATAGASALALPLHKQVTNAQYYQLRWEAKKNGYLDRTPGATEEQAEDYATSTLISGNGGYNAFDKYPLLPDGQFDPTAKPRWTTKWEDELFKPGLRNQYYLGVSGGHNGLSYAFSMGYLKDKGYLTFSNYDRYNSRLDISDKVNKWLDVGLNVNYSRGLQKTPDGTRQVRIVLDLPDIYPVYIWDDATNTYALDANGKRIPDMGGGNIYSYDKLTRGTWANTNPLEEARDDINQNEINDAGARAYISITPVKGLNLKSSLAADYTDFTHKEYWSSQYGFAAASGGQASSQSTRSLTYTFSNLATYNRTIGDHTFSLLAGMETYYYRSDMLSTSGTGLPLPTIVEVGAAANITGGSSMEDNHRIGSYLSKLDYSYKDKYFLSLSYRRDGTSRFSAENRWGNFGAGGLSWRISKENFMDGVSGWLNDLILRASYGTQGNERISNYYAYRGLYNVTSDLGATAFQLSTLTNDALHWENTKQTNIGLSASLFKRITVDFDYFIKKTDDMLFNRSLPVSSGVASIAENVGDLKNQGFDIQIHSSNLESSKGLNWQTTINLSHYTNRIVRLPSQEISNGLFRWAVGTSAYNYYLPKWLGVNPDDGKPLWLKETFLMDADGNPVINSKGERTVTKTEITEDYTQATYNYRGSALPDLFGNIINNFSYRAFDLSFNFYFSIGGQFFDYAYQRLSHPGSRQPVVDFTEDAMDYWTPEHKNASFTRLTDYGPEGNNYFANSTRYLVNDTYLRLRDVTLGYTLPVSLGSRIGVSSIRVFVQADNQLTFFKYKNKGVDPEQPIGGLLDITAMPVAKFIIGGISVKF